MEPWPQATGTLAFIGQEEEKEEAKNTEKERLPKEEGLGYSMSKPNTCQ